MGSVSAPGAANPFHAQVEYNSENFKKVKFENGRVTQREFYDCTFANCSLRESIFRDCKFTDCTFQDCDLSLVRFEGSSFSEVSFERCKLTGVNWTLAAWSQFAADSPISFRECVIDYSAFIGLTLRKIVILKCSAQEVEFSDTDLSNANFSGTNLAKSRFNQTNLTKANFEGATNYMIDLKVNKISKAKFALPEALSLLYGLDIVLIE